VCSTKKFEYSNVEDESPRNIFKLIKLQIYTIVFLIFMPIKINNCYVEKDSLYIMIYDIHYFETV
jgi:hypothetical protein